MDDITPFPAPDSASAVPPPGHALPPNPPDHSRPTEPADRLVLRSSRPSEVLAWIPYELGFWPRNSMVFISLRDDSGQEVGLRARIDIDALGGATHARRMQVEMSRHLQRDGARRVLCAVYLSDPFASVLRGKGDAGRALDWWRSTPWFAAEHTYLVGAERFRCLACAQQPCCPDTGQPVEVLRDTEVAAWCVYHGRSYVLERADLVADPWAPTRDRRSASAAASRHQRARPDRPGQELAGWQRAMTRRWVALVAACGGGGTALDPDLAILAAGLAGEIGEDWPPSAASLGAVLAGFADSWVRDAILLWTGTGQLLGASSRDHVVDAVFSGRLPPNLPRLRSAEAVLTLLSAHASSTWKAPVVACQAWLAWWAGEGARANILCRRALDIDPELSLAVLLGTAIEHGIPPGWVRATRSA